MSRETRTTIRPPAVAGQFYPRDPEALSAAVEGYLEAAKVPSDTGQATPKALIVPHAGYVYSGPIAASAYARISDAAASISRIVLLGPAHGLPFKGLALPPADGFETPLGVVPLDAAAMASIEQLPQVQRLPAAHTMEHSLEVQLPFLQCLLRSFSLVPLAVGAASPEEVAAVLELLWGGEETLIVISTDLSHYHDFETAKRRDAATAAAIEALDEGAIGPDDACGCVPLSGLLASARNRGMTVRKVDLRSPGETAGRRRRVVGYGAFVVT